MYTEEFKKAAIQKLILRGNRSVIAVCDEMGISTPTVYGWKKKYGRYSGMDKVEKSPQNRSPEEKFKAVMEFDRLDESERGLFLRREGFHTDHIDEWRRQMQEGLKSKNGTNTRGEMAELNREVRDLKKELTRKNAALAETTALLVLKKKADLIFGSGEGE
jgi:transposase